MFIKSIDASSQVKNATYLCEVIEEVIAEVGEEHVMQVVTDNTVSYVPTGKLLRFKFNLSNFELFLF